MKEKSMRNPITIDPRKFHESITGELDLIQNRVRNLIGNSHWGEDGNYKEAVLRSVIKRFLPKNISVGTGFIIKKKNNIINNMSEICDLINFKNFNNDFDELADISYQIDIIIYNNNYPVLFEEGDFIITTPKNVKGIIEVKTALNYKNLEEAIIKSTHNGNLFDQKIFNGIFSYNETNIFREGRINDNFRNALVESNGVVNHICLGKNIFIKYWDEFRDDRNRQTIIDIYRIYKIDGLSFSYFISNLAEQISYDRLMERWWFLYPIEDGKENYKIDEVRLA
jgi:hypothetical protein